MKNNLSVAIVDDEMPSIDIISSSVLKIFNNRGLNIDCYQYQNPKDFFQSLKEKDFDLCFLDISIGEINGIDLAKKLSEAKGESTPTIIFVSSHQDRVFDSLSVNPFGFVRKNNFFDDIYSVINRYIDNLVKQDSKSQVIHFEDGTKTYTINVNNISFIESNRNIQIIHFFKQPSITIHNTMDKLDKWLTQYGLIRIHKSFLVNPAAIFSFDKKEVKLYDKTLLSIGRAYYQYFMTNYMSYVRLHHIGKIG